MSNQQIQRVKVKRLGQVGLWTTDVVAQSRFYYSSLGFDVSPAALDARQVLEDDEMTIFLSLGEEHECLGLFNDTRTNTTHNRRSVQNTLLHHLSFEVETDAELAAIAARLQSSGIELTFAPRAGDPNAGDSLWLSDPDGNRLEIFAHPYEILPAARSYRSVQHPNGLQHVALYTPRLESMVDFYCDALGFDVSDWLLRERVWLRCNQNHHTLMLIEGEPAIDHVGYSIADGSTLLQWADTLGQYQIPLVWGPGHHGASDDLFVRFVDPNGIHIELSAGMQHSYSHEMTAPPRLWHTRMAALNLWGMLPAWLHEDGQG